MRQMKRPTLSASGNSTGGGARRVQHEGERTAEKLPGLNHRPN